MAKYIEGSAVESTGVVVLNTTLLKVTDLRDYNWTIQVTNLDGETAAVEVKGPAGVLTDWTETASPLDADQSCAVIGVGLWTEIKVTMSAPGAALVTWTGRERA